MSLDQPAGRQPDHPVAPEFPARWSPRSFTDREVSQGEVMSLLEAARWAPSASNHQPWRIIWARRGEAAFEAMVGTLTGNNPVWAGKAGAIFAVATSEKVTNREGVEVQNRTAGFDTGSAWMSLALQARTMGLIAHAMGGFDVEKLAEVVHLPKGHTLQCVVAVGEQGPAEALPESLKEREKPSSRKPLAEISRHGSF